MLIFKFESADGRVRQFAATAQRGGANLPAGGQPWRFLASVDVRPEDGSSSRIGAPSNQVLRGIAEEGYFMWVA
jgi:hypothetical protein